MTVGRGYVVLGVPRGKKEYEEFISKIESELKSRKIRYKVVEIEDPYAVPGLALRENSLVWDFIGDEILVFIRSWDAFKRYIIGEEAGGQEDVKETCPEKQ